MEQSFDFRDRLFEIDDLYSMLENAARTLDLRQTLTVLPKARQWHDGQVRKGPGAVPYIIHPLTTACHALAMGLTDDDLLAALLLHDVVEDCGVTPAQLPVGEAVRRAVMLVSHVSGQTPEDYFGPIAADPLAAMVKVIDRCNNLSGMAAGFTRARAADYVRETEARIMPLLDVLPALRPDWTNACWLLRYQMTALLETFKHLL